MAPAAVGLSPRAPEEGKAAVAESGRPCGLKNLGNTCYLNSVLQCLAFTPLLADFCCRSYHSSICRKLIPERENECVLCVLESQIFRLRRPLGMLTRPPLESPSKVLRCIPQFGDTFRLGRQEDAHELLRFVVDACHSACLRVRKRLGPGAADDTKQGAELIMQRIFGGVLASQVKCLSCKGESNKADEIMDLSLDISGCGSVDAALARFFQVEVLDGANKYSCEKCKKLTIAKKQMFLLRAPSVLVIQLKRFTPVGGKINRNIEFEELLLLSNFMHKVSQDSQPQYSLFGTVVHSGFSPECGHYYAYVKDASGVWYCCNDAHVSLSSSQEVLSEKVYMLFYRLNNEVPKYSANGYRPANSLTKLAGSSGPDFVHLKHTEKLGALSEKKFDSCNLKMNATVNSRSAKTMQSLQINLKRGDKITGECDGNANPIFRSNAECNVSRTSSETYSAKNANRKGATSNDIGATSMKNSIEAECSNTISACSNGSSSEGLADCSIRNVNDCTKLECTAQNVLSGSSDNGSLVHLFEAPKGSNSEKKTDVERLFRASTKSAGNFHLCSSSRNAESSKLPDECWLNIEEEKLKELLSIEVSSQLRSCGWVDNLYDYMRSRKRLYVKESGESPESIISLRKRLRADFERNFKPQIPQSVKEHLIGRVRTYFEDGVRQIKR